SVLGDFNDASFDYYGVRSRFFRRDGKYFVETDGPDGKLATFEVKYTFGVDPLQQYLIEFPDGRLQALRDHLGRAQPRLRGLPRPRLAPRRLGAREAKLVALRQRRRPEEGLYRSLRRAPRRGLADRFQDWKCAA